MLTGGTQANIYSTWPPYYSWLMDAGRAAAGGFSDPRSYYFSGAAATAPLYRQQGFTYVSYDCGSTWYADGRIMPLKLDGFTENDEHHPQNSGGNGVNHFVINPDANWANQAFATHMDWTLNGGMSGRIYPVFASANGWGWQATSGTAIPNPVLGSPNLASSGDNFYSPSVTVEGGDYANLYFGGWRDHDGHQAVKPCRGPNAAMMDSHGNVGYNKKTGPTEETCSCRFSNNAGGLGNAIDQCTGDKIYLATNLPKVIGNSGNRLKYAVYRVSNQSWSLNQFDSSQFEPVVSSARVNRICPPPKLGGVSNTCPMPIVHSNDATVIKLPTPVLAHFKTMKKDAQGNYVTPYPAQQGIRYQYLMYFSGVDVVGDDLDPSTPGGKGEFPNSINYTHVGLSLDGKRWTAFAILKPGRKVIFPGNAPFNFSNGRVRAAYDKTNKKIFLVSGTTAEALHYFPSIAAENNHWQLYVIDPLTPDLVNQRKTFKFTPLTEPAAQQPTPAAAIWSCQVGQTTKPCLIAE